MTTDNTLNHKALVSGVPRPVTAAYLSTQKKLGPMPDYSRCWLVNDRVVVKTGRGVKRSEAETLRLLKERGLQVPEVYDDYVDPATGDHVIVMEYIEGAPLDQVMDSYGPEQKRALISQLQRFTTTMRQEMSTTKFIGSVDRTDVKDLLFVQGRAGPFECERDFVNGLADSLHARAEGSWIKLVTVLLGHLPDHGDEFVMTHGDLNARNILVRGSEIVAILDWGQAGYYPEHWESVKSCFWDLDLDFFHKAVVEEVLRPYPLELSVMLHARDIVW
jgi:RIO-like serine/threonine protein kinase